MAGAVPYLACAVTFSYCERLVDPTWAKWQEVFYYMFLAFGGEVAADASTECGQAAICLLVINGMIGASLLMTLLLQAATLAPEQQLLIATLDKKKLDDAIKNEAARGIQKVMRVFASIKALRGAQQEDTEESGRNSPSFQKLQSSPGFVRESELRRMMEDKKHYKAYVFSVLQDWKRSKKDGKQLGADFPTRMVTAFRELRANLINIQDDVKFIKQRMFPELKPFQPQATSDSPKGKRSPTKGSPKKGSRRATEMTQPETLPLVEHLENLTAKTDLYDASQDAMRLNLRQMTATLTEFISLAEKRNGG